MRLALATAFALLLAAPAFAEPFQSSPANLPVGAVACVNLREAKNYTTYSKNAPDFAEVQLARAACFKNRSELAAVTKAVVGDYTQLELLSGHRVWLLSTYLSVK